MSRVDLSQGSLSRMVRRQRYPIFAVCSGLVGQNWGAGHYDRVRSARNSGYLGIMPIGYALYGVLNISQETLNAVGRPLLAAGQTVIQMFLLYAPLAWVGANQVHTCL